MMSAVRGLTRRLPILIPFFWLLVFFLTPFFIVLQISFAEFQYGQPPYVPNFRKVEGVGDFFNQLQATRALERFEKVADSNARLI